MKKIAMVFVCLMTIVAFTSCGTNGIESDAKENMEALLKDLAKNPKSLEITNVKALFVSDSCVVLTCTTSGQNGFGGYHKSRFAYLYTIYKFNIIGTKKIDFLLRTDSDEKLETAMWEKIKTEINDNPKDSVENTIKAYTIVFGRNIETGEPIVNEFK